MLKRRRVDDGVEKVVKAKKALKPDQTSNVKIRKASPAPLVKKAKNKDDEKIRPSEKAPTGPQSDHVSIQIVTGSYGRILHGFILNVPTSALESSSGEHKEASQQDEQQASFTETFLFAAHGSSIRSLAVSPAPDTNSNKRILATGSSDERINLYQLSTSALSGTASDRPKLPSLASTSSAISENPRNRELGSLLHHSRTVTRLSFPTKGKLFSAAEDNTIAITRVRDWTMLSSIKAPVPKAVGRPSGDTAAPGEVPAGVNDFAIHPSMKLMISVGKGERCMRLWNLVTGKKAGVLNFDKAVLAQIDEGRYSSGEGQRVIWSGDGESFIVMFERGAVVYSMDSQAVAVVKLSPPSKVHQIRAVPGVDGMVAMATEDGRVLFFSLQASAASNGSDEGTATKGLPGCRCVAQISSQSTDPSGRIKDFELLQIPGQAPDVLVCLAASSDGAVRAWSVDLAALDQGQSGADVATKTSPAKEVGRSLGIKESGNRLTCLTAFVMDSAAEGDVGGDVALPEANGDLSDSGSSSDE